MFSDKVKNATRSFSWEQFWYIQNEFLNKYVYIGKIKRWVLSCKKSVASEPKNKGG